MTPSSLRVGLALIAAVIAACDNQQAFHEPEPGLERMLLQPRGIPYGASTAFADGRIMRPPVPDSVPREQPYLGQVVIETGSGDGGYVQDIPQPVTRATLKRGHLAFERVCAACHGVLGDGNSVVAEKMTLRKPPSLHEVRIARLPSGKVFEVVSLGYGLMPGFAAQLSIDDRWGVVGYLEALRLSQAVPAASLADSMRAELRQEAP